MTMEQNKEYELMKRFIEENTDITLKFMMWQEEFLDPQIFTQQVDADEIECEVLKLNINEDGFIN